MRQAIKFPDGTIIGAEDWFDMYKKPVLFIEKGNQITKYGSFNNGQSAVDFMDELGKLLGCKD